MTLLQTYIGVRQGDNLSPILFKIFINDLVDSFDESCKPVTLNSLNLNRLLYADDLVLMSETADGLQICIDKLYDYCENMGLQININNIYRKFKLKYSNLWKSALNNDRDNKPGGNE